MQHDCSLDLNNKKADRITWMSILAVYILLKIKEREKKKNDERARRNILVKTNEMTGVILQITSSYAQLI